MGELDYILVDEDNAEGYEPFQPDLEENLYSYEPPNQLGMTPALQEAMIAQESAGDPMAVSPKGAFGVMQVMPAMWEAYGGGDPRDVNEQKRVGTAIYQDEFARFSGNQDLALAAYNAGSPAVITALKEAGYTLKDAANVPFDEIAPYLPKETQEYVPQIQARMRANTGTDSYGTPSGPDPLVITGSEQDLKEAITPEISRSDFDTLSTPEKLQILTKIYNSKENWTPEAQNLMKGLTTTIWAGALPNEQVHFGQLVGAPPRLEKTDNDPDATLAKWKAQKINELQNSGINPLFFGDQLETYLDAAIESEKTAYRYRNRSKFGEAVSQTGSFVAGIAKGGVQGITGGVAFLPRIAGFEETAETIESASNLIPDPARSSIYEVDEDGNIKFDEYGEPLTKFRGSIANALGQVASVFTIAGSLNKLGAGAKTIGGFVGGINVFQNANEAYKDAIDNGGTSTEAQIAAALSLPSSAIDTLGDLVVLGGGKVWLKGLGTFNKARAIATEMGKKAAVEGVTEGAQQLTQDIGTSVATGQNLIKGRRVLEAVVAGGIAGGVVGGLTTATAVRPISPDIEIDESVVRRTREKLTGLPAPEERLGLPAPESLQGLPGPEAGTLQLPYTPPKPPAVISMEGPIQALDLPDADSQIHLAQQFEDYQSSPDFDKLFIIRSPSDVDAELLQNFGYRGIINEDGQLRVIKDTTHIPADPKNLTPEGLDQRIENVARDLATLPRPEDAQQLVARRREIQQELQTLEPKQKAQAVATEQLQGRKQALIKEITQLKRLKKTKGANKHLAQVRLREAREELTSVNDYLNKNTDGVAAVKLQNELRRVNDAIKQLSDPRFMNNVKAKENELRNLLTTRDVATEEFNTALQEKENVTASEQSQAENAQRGLGIQTRNGIRYVLPFQNQWYVMNEEGRAMSRGFPNIASAIDTARGVIATEAEGGLTRAPEPYSQKGMARPLKFKQRIEVPFYIVKGVNPEETTDTTETETTTEEPTAPPTKKKKPTPKKVKEESQEEFVRETPQALRSKTTGFTYTEPGKETQGVHPELRRLVNYWASALKLPETVVGTFEDYNRGDLDTLLTPEQKAMVERAKKSGKFETSEGFADIADGKGFILLRNAGNDFASARYASHEVGHILFRDGFANAPDVVRKAALKDFTNTIKELGVNDTAEVWGNRLIGAENPFQGDTTPFSQLPIDKQEYLASHDAGFEEFFANQVSAYALDPNKKAVGGAQQLYKQIGTKLRQVWEGLKRAFKQSPPIQEWLDEQFSTERGNAFVNPQFGRGKDVASGPGTRERQFAERVRKSKTTSEETKTKLGEQTYRQQSPIDVAKKFRAKIKPDDLDSNIAEITDFGNNLSYQERTVYGIEVLKELQRQITQAQKAGKPIDALTTKEADLVSKMAMEGTELGRGIQAFSLFSSMSFPGMLKRFQNDLKRMHEGKPGPSPEIPPEVQADLRKIYDRMRTVESETPGSESLEVIDNVIMNTLAQDAVNIVAGLTPTPLRDAIAYYWYSNILSGGSTQTINAAGSGMNLFLKTLGTAITTPQYVIPMLSGYARGIKKGTTTARGLWRGRIQSKGKYEARALRSNRVPVLQLENKAMQALVGNPLNFFNKKLQIVPRSMNSVDAFFYKIAEEGQAYLAASRALARDGTIDKADMPARLAEMLHNSTEEWKTAEDQARREWTASEIAHDEKDVLLRTQEIIEQRRPVEIQKKAKRFGLLATYNEKPEGSLGAAADLINEAVRKIAPLRIVFPFVNVVSNVLSQALDYSPIGILRAASGGHLLDRVNRNIRGVYTGTPFEPEERLQRLGSGLIGTLLGYAVYATAEGYLDDKDPYFAIFARGPKGAGELATKKAAGWSPYTVKIGDTYIKYSETPLAPLFAWIGELHDAYRYSPSFNKKNPGEQWTLNLAKVGGVILDTGFLQGISNLWDTLHGDRNPIDALVAAPARGLIPFQGILRDIAKSTDDFILDSKDEKSRFVRGLPFIQGAYGKPSLTAFGEPLEVPKIAEGIPVLEQTLGRFVSTENTDPAWRFLSENDLHISSLGTQSSVGIAGASAGRKARIERTKEERAKTLGRAAFDTLTYDEIYEITKLAGPKIRRGVEGLMQRKNISGEKLQAELDKLVQKARNEAKIEYFGY